MIEKTLEIIKSSGVIAVIRLDDLSKAVRMTRAYLEGGITALEFTLTNPGAIKALIQTKANCPEFENGQAVMGIGTVLNAAQAQAAIGAGAQFLVSPHTNLGVIKAALASKIAVMPGALTPTEIVTAHEAGASAIKIFPARTFGATYLKDVLAPLPMMKLIPTGGIDAVSVGDYIKYGALAVGIGGNLVDKDAIAAGDWDKLTATARNYVELVAAAR